MFPYKYTSYVQETWIYTKQGSIKWILITRIVATLVSKLFEYFFQTDKIRSSLSAWMLQTEIFFMVAKLEHI